MAAISDEFTTGSETVARYDRVQRLLHWLMAAIILAAVAIGLYCSTQAPGTPVRRALLEVHKSLGMTALVLVVIRVGYRLFAGAPSHGRYLGRLTRLAANSAHLMLYALMVMMPVTGYLFSAAGGYSLPWFGLFQWPRLVPVGKALASTWQYFHDWGADIIYVVLALHLAAVAWHHFVMKDDVLARMLPPRRKAS